GCFGKAGNAKYRALLLGHPHFGPILTKWEEERSIPLWVKWVSCSCITFFCGLSVYAVPVMWVKGLIVALGLAGIGYILSKKTSRESKVSVDGDSYDLAS